MNDVEVHRTDGRVERYSRVGHLPLARGDLVRFMTGTGASVRKFGQDLRSTYVPWKQRTRRP